MAKTVTKYSIFIASPSDLEEERVAIEEVTKELNLTYGAKQNIVIELIKWETHSAPGISEIHPQELINNDLGNNYDIFIGLLWKKFGTPTDKAGSGTEEEFLRAFNRFTGAKDKIQVLFYFKDALPPARASIMLVPSMSKKVNLMFFEKLRARRYERDARTSWGKSKSRISSNGTTMKTISIFLFSCITAIGFSQKKYSFDHLIEYKVTHLQDSVRIKHRTFWEKDTIYRKFLLTNSKLNNYLAVLTELDNHTYILDFKDNDGVSFRFKIPKSTFHSNELMEVPCELVSAYINPNTYQTKNYDFVRTTDTIINDRSYWKYKLASNKPKRIKKLNLGTEYYIIDKETSFHSPILEFSSAYEEWKIEQNLPNGILFEKYFIDFHGHLDTKEKLTGYHKIKKEISIDKKCDYSRN